MRAWAIVALVATASARPAAQGAAWRADAGVTALVEAWDVNQSRESLAGLAVGVDRRVWRPLAIRVEGMVLRIAQATRDGWLGGLTVGSRARWADRRARPFLDLAVGVAQGTTDTPPGGTASNFLIVSGVGVGVPVGRVALDLSARWWHLSNNGREGRHRNPDIQALGVIVAIGWIP